MGGRLTHPTMDLTGRVAIVTGANQGIGYETAKAIGCMGAHVIMACRSEQRAEQAIERMKQECEGKEIRAEFMKLDLASLQSTKDFIEAFKQKNLPLHLLICNAGVSGMALTKTENDLELQFQTNHLSHLYICVELLSCMLNTEGDRRIVILSSVLHTIGVWDPTNLQGEVSYSRMKFYGNSKLYNIMMAYSLRRRLKETDVTICAVHPGVVSTDILTNYDTMIGKIGLMLYVRPFGKSVQQGAVTSINCGVNPELVSQEMLYYSASPRSSLPNNLSRNEANQEELWSISFDLLKDWLSPEAKQRYGPTATAPVTDETPTNTQQTTANDPANDDTALDQTTTSAD